MQLKYLSSKIIQAAINVHKELGPGLLELVYKQCMAIELSEMGLQVTNEVDVPVSYRGQSIDGLVYLSLTEYGRLSEKCNSVGKMLGSMLGNPDPFLLKL